MEKQIQIKIQELKANNNLHLEVIERLGKRWLLYIDIETAEIVIERLLKDNALDG